MRRVVINLLTVLSLLICAAGVAAWVGGRWHAHHAIATWGEHSFSLVVAGGEGGGVVGERVGAVRADVPPGDERLPEFHRSRFESIRLGWPDIPEGYLGVGDSDLGDPLFLDTGKLTADGDCPVVWVDHETSEVVHTWPSISLFLKDAVEPAEEDV